MHCGSSSFPLKVCSVSSPMVSVPVNRDYKNLTEFVHRIDNSVPRVTVWHHKAPPGDVKQ